MAVQRGEPGMLVTLDPRAQRAAASGPTKLVLRYGRVPTAGMDAAVAGLAAALRDAGL
jgi:hypothetical protein